MSIAALQDQHFHTNNFFGAIQKIRRKSNRKQAESHRGLRAIQTKGEKSEPQLPQYKSLYPRDPKSPKFETLETQNLID